MKDTTKVKIEKYLTEEKYDIEKLASVQHDIWVHWMKYLFSVCDERDGEVIIPKDKVSRWKRQMNASYNSLSGKEKQSDKDQVKKLLKVIGE